MQNNTQIKVINLLCSLVDDKLDPLASIPVEESVVEDCIGKYEEVCRDILLNQGVLFFLACAIHI